MSATSSQNIENCVRQHLGQTLLGIDSPLPDYRGKVRDVFFRGDELVIVTSDRISAFDVVLGAVPFKGALLTEQATFWLHKSRDVIANHLLERVDAQVMLCKKAEPLRVEMVVRGYLAGSLLREAPEQRGRQYGISVDPALGAYERFPEPIITATTKADVGEHDLPISFEQIVAQGLVSKRHLDEMASASLALFQLGTLFSQSQGLLLVDTKYEFGLCDGKVTLIDEIHTADSSRYWIAGSYADRLSQNQIPEMLDKERLRTTLVDRGYDGHNTATIPKLDDEMRLDLACHYWKLTEILTAQSFAPPADAASHRVSSCLAKLGFEVAS